MKTRTGIHNDMQPSFLASIAYRLPCLPLFRRDGIAAQSFQTSVIKTYNPRWAGILLAAIMLGLLLAAGIGAAIYLGRGMPANLHMTSLFTISAISV